MKENIDVSFKDFGDQTFGFNSPFDISDKTIVIDPVPTRIWEAMQVALVKITEELRQILKIQDIFTEQQQALLIFQLQELINKIFLQRLMLS